MKTTKSLVLIIAFFTLTNAQIADRQQVVRVEAALVALTHVRLIDGTGAAPAEDQTIIISDGKVQSIGPSPSAKIPNDARTIDLSGYSILPGLVGMHDHMFFPMGGSPPMYSN